MEGLEVFGQLINVGESLYTPWFPRSADNGVFTYEILSGSGANLVVSVYTKNSEDQGPGVLLVSGFTPDGTTGIYSKEVDEGLEELVRFHVVCSEEGSLTRFRFLDTTWFNQAHG